MLTREIISSCSNARVAQAALASIGGPFAARFEAHADGIGMDMGLLAAQTVRQFAETARPRDWDMLRDAITGADQPVLAGLRHILAISLRDADVLPEAHRQTSANPGFGYSATRGNTVGTSAFACA